MAPFPNAVGMVDTQRLQEKIPGLSKNQALKAWANAAAVAWHTGGRGRVALEEALPPGLVNRASD